MKKIMKRSDSNRGIAPRNLSVALLLSLVIIGAGCEQSQAADLNTNISPAEREKFVSEGSELTNLREGTLTETSEESIQIDTQTVNQVKKSLSSGKKSNKFFKSLSDKVSNDTTLQHTERGLATGAAAEYTPILDNLYDSGDSAVQSAYQFTETTATSGNNVFKIGDKYYQLTYKDSFYEQFTNPTLDRAYEAGESSISSAYTLTETTATSGTNVYKIGDKYYQFAIKDGVTSGGRITTNQNGNPVTTHIFGSVVNNSNG
ncbi:MAG: hypothetical protein II085_05735, partial [Alphaproteobacteria bacterium]|nr:hypothetical protein [Alphaproteobacteria bacterium]